MIRTYPIPSEGVLCPYCGGGIVGEPFWQGIHICVKGECPHCRVTIVSDLLVGQALYTPYQVCVERGEVFGDECCKGWFGQPFLESLLSPDDASVEFQVEKLRPCNRVIVLNCSDFLYGHCLLKLLNADRHLRQDQDYGLIVIVPKLLRWMVPDGVAEIWTVNLSLHAMRRFYPDLDQKIQHECKRFSEIRLSPAYSHPSDFDITRFTRIPRHDFSKENIRITFIWRNDRLWFPTTLMYRVFRKLGTTAIFRWWQKQKVIRLFKMLKAILPDVRYTVAGVGNDGNFPSWIDDQRIAPPLADDQERMLCEIYSDSRVVVGVHGSNMLLPSAHAGMVVDLMPTGRWGNMIQDILYHEHDNRLAAYLYRYLPLDTRLNVLVEVVSQQIGDYCGFVKRMQKYVLRNNRGEQHAR